MEEHQFRVGDVVPREAQDLTHAGARHEQQGHDEARLAPEGVHEGGLLGV